MKLTLSLPLIWMLFSSAEALECMQDSGHIQACNSDEQCLTVANQGLRFNKLNENITLKTCAPSSLCNEDKKSFSISFEDFQYTASFQCCSTDGCNRKDIPYPDEQKPNGLQCFSCYSRHRFCNKTVQCLGNQDRCYVVNGEALKCVQDSHTSDQQPCNTDEQCLTAAHQDFAVTEIMDNIILRTCAPSSFCNEGPQTFSFSYDVYRLTSSLQCCSTDGCNNKDIPYLDEQKPNGLQCFTCHPFDHFCNKTQQCLGIEDSCITINETSGGETHEVRGCASANLCEGHTDLKLNLLFDQSIVGEGYQFSAPECCETSLCNSAPADKLSVISLLLALVALSIC